MKKRKMLVVLVLLAAGILASCVNFDGIESVYIPNENSGIIEIKDDDNSNGIHIDTKSMKIRCPVGPDEVINLPVGTTTATAVLPDVFAVVSAEYVCIIGQERFDADLAMFDQLPPPLP